IPPDSPDAELLAEACVAWSVVGVHAPNAAGGATQVRIRHRGREVVAFSVAGPLQDVQPAIRREVMKSVTGEAPPGPVLGEKSISRNQQALELYADGDLGGAEAVLKRAIAEDMDSSLLRNNYAQVLVDRARTQRLLALYGSESRSAARAGVDGRALLLEALGELDYAVALDPSSPWSRHNRGQLWRELAELGGEGDALGKAEADFRAALALMPSFAESASDLAALLLDRGRPRDVAEAMRWLKRARGVVSRRDRSTRASIAKNLGRAYALAHRPDRALEAFEEAECLAPIDRWGLRAEVLGRQAVLVEKALGPATADVAWRRYDLFSRPREKDPLRPLYEDWRRRFPDPGGTARFGMWSRRCSSGQLAARKAIRAAAAEGGEPSAISISAIAEQFTDAPGLRGGRG
ncbi:MAG: tetratricopeptide repeat protein, partial [Acidobacteriota bacterium]